MKRPNILWISFEDTNPFYGCYGDTVARTPNLDRLAGQGCIWPRAYSTAGVCAPARSAVITGMYPISIGTHHMRTAHTNQATPEMPTPYSAVVPHYVRCFSEYFRAAGYWCSNNVKTDYQFDPPVTAWDELSNKAHWRNRPDPDQPFFAVFNPTRTHESCQWPEQTPQPTFNPDDIQLPPCFPDTPEVRLAMARMYTRIEESDTELGQLLAQLEEDSLAENTIVVHWSDHGPLPRGKRWPYDSGIHVPMIVRWPGQLEPGSRSDDLVSTVDLGPTMLSCAGLEIPRYMQGQAFLGPGKAPPRRYVYATRDRYDESYDCVRAVRDKRYKYIRNNYPLSERLLWVPYRNRHPIIQELYRLEAADLLNEAQKLMFRYPRPAEELYDTETDPHELHNLAGKPQLADTLQRMRDALADWIDRVGDMGEIDEAQMVRQWYPQGKQPTTARPVAIPISQENPGIEPAQGACELAGPALLQLHCATQGASIAWTTETGDDPHWQLYTRAIRLQGGQTRLRAKAIRIGYAESPEAAWDLQIKETS
ncbi:MAG: sulfatase [Phycisphaerae bacterium]